MKRSFSQIHLDLKGCKTTLSDCWDTCPPPPRKKIKDVKYTVMGYLDYSIMEYIKTKRWDFWALCVFKIFNSSHSILVYFVHWPRVLWLCFVIYFFFQKFLVYLLGFRQSCHLWIKITSFLSFHYTHFLFSCLIEPARTPSTVLKRSAEKGHFLLFPNLREKISYHKVWCLL